jgi:hypothetical protein
LQPICTDVCYRPKAVIRIFGIDDRFCPQDGTGFAILK